jgi:hypothetical protein
MRRYFAVFFISLALFAFGGFSESAAENNATSISQVSDAEVSKQDATLSANVKGFRSAKFGMTESEIRAAIARDFGASDAIKQTENLSERTRGLSARVRDLLPGGGTAQVSYVFGYKTKKLIQVSVTWSRATDSSLTAQKLVANGDVLRASFLEQGYLPGSVVTDALTRDGVLIFRGADDAGHTTALLLEGRAALGKTQKNFTPVALLLLYISDPKHPDVFRLAPGQF